MQSATVLIHRKPAQRDRFGKILEGLSGSESVACSERSNGNLGGPSTSFGQLSEGKIVQPQEGCLMGQQSEGSQIIS